MKALCDASSKEYNYIRDESAETYLQALVSRLGSATVRIVDDAEPWADSGLCRVILISKGLLQTVATEGELVQTIAHMYAHTEQPPMGARNWVIRYSHRNQTLYPQSLEQQFAQREADAWRRATALLATFPTDPNNEALKAIQARFPLPAKKKPTLLR